VTEADVSSVASGLWKNGLTIASVGDVTRVPKRSAL
jgi:hypothetical protein